MAATPAPAPGEWMVVGADRSDGSFNRLPATIAIVTNIDPEHMGTGASSTRCARAFTTSSPNIPFYGLAVCCTDHPEVQALVGRVSDHIVPSASTPRPMCALNLRYENGIAHFDIALRARPARAAAGPR